MSLLFTEFLQPSAAIELTPIPLDPRRSIISRGGFVPTAISSVAIPIVNLDGLGLKIEWDIERTRSSAPDQGTITAYNLSPALRNAIYADWKVASNIGRPMSLDIGWGPLTCTVFRGDAWHITPALHSGEDVLTIWQVGDGNKQVRDATVGASYTNITFIALIRVLVIQNLGIVMEAASQRLIEARVAAMAASGWNGIFGNYTDAGDTASNLTDLLSPLNLEWKILNGFFVVMERGNLATSFPLAFVLAVESGLLEWAPLDDGGIEVTALANPQIAPGHQFQVVDPTATIYDLANTLAARYRVETVRFTGSTDGQSVMSIVGRKSTPV